MACVIACSSASLATQPWEQCQFVSLRHSVSPALASWVPLPSRGPMVSLISTTGGFQFAKPDAVCATQKAAAAEATDAVATNWIGGVGVIGHAWGMVIESSASEAKATAFPQLGIFQRRGVAVTIGSAGATLTPAVAAIIRATEAPMTALPVRINN